MEPDIGFQDSHKIEAYWKKVIIMIEITVLMELMIIQAFIWHACENHFLCLTSINFHNICSTTAC